MISWTAVNNEAGVNLANSPTSAFSSPPTLDDDSDDTRSFSGDYNRRSPEFGKKVSGNSLPHLRTATTNSKGKAPVRAYHKESLRVSIEPPTSRTQTNTTSSVGLVKPGGLWRSAFEASPGHKRNAGYALLEFAFEASSRRIKSQLRQGLTRTSRVGSPELDNGDRNAKRTWTDRRITGLMIGIDLGTTNSAVAYSEIHYEYDYQGNIIRRDVDPNDINDVVFDGNTSLEQIETIGAYDRTTFKFGPDELLEANVRPCKVLSLVKMLLGGQPPENIHSTVEIIKDLDVSGDCGVKPNATVMSITAAMLGWLYKHTVRQIINSHYPVTLTEDGYRFLDLPIEFVLCVPAVWGLESNDKALTALNLACDRTVEVDASNKARFTRRDFDRGQEHVFTLAREPTCAAATAYKKQARIGHRSVSVGLLQVATLFPSAAFLAQFKVEADR